MHVFIFLILDIMFLLRNIKNLRCNFQWVLYITEGFDNVLKCSLKTVGVIKKSVRHDVAVSKLINTCETLFTGSTKPIFQSRRWQMSAQYTTYTSSNILFKHLLLQKSLSWMYEISIQVQECSNILIFRNVITPLQGSQSGQ